MIYFLLQDAPGSRFRSVIHGQSRGQNVISPAAAPMHRGGKVQLKLIPYSCCNAIRSLHKYCILTDHYNTASCCENFLQLLLVCLISEDTFREGEWDSTAFSICCGK